MKLSILILTVLFAATSFLTTGCKKKDDSPVDVKIDSKQVEDAAKDVEKDAGKALDSLQK